MARKPGDDGKPVRKRRGRGEGGICQRPDGIWEASVSQGFDANGKRVRIRVFGKTKAEALEKLDKAKHGGIPRDRVTVGEFIADWLERGKGTVEEGTWIQREQHVRIHIAPRIGHLKLNAFDPAAAAGFVARMRREEVSAAMVKKVVVTARNALSDAVRAGILPRDPFDGVPLPKHTRPIPKPLEPAEAAALLAVAEKDRLGAIIAVAIDSGLRQGELFALRWNDYDPTTGAVTVTKSLAQINGKLKVKAAKTTNSRRMVVLDFARPILDAHREKMREEGRDVQTGIVFCNEAGDYLRKSNFLRRTFARLRKAAGVPKLKFHEMRHSSATLMLLAGVDTKTVSSRLGHGSAGFTMNTYQHVIAGMQAKAAGALAGVLTAAAIGHKQATVEVENAPEPGNEKPRKS